MREVNRIVMRLNCICFIFSFFINLAAYSQTTGELLSQIDRPQSDSIKVGLYEKLFDATKNSNHVLAGQSIREMDRLSRKLNYAHGIEKVLDLKGSLCFYSNESDSALHYYRKYLRSGSVKSSPLLKVKTYSNMGLVHQQRQRNDSAVFYFNKSLEYCKKIDCGQTMCAILNNLGLTVYSIGNMAKSLQYFEQAYQCMLEHDDQENLPNIINNLASLYALNGKPDPDKLFLKMLESPALNEGIKATVYLNLGSFYFRNDDAEKAERYFIEAQKLFAKIGQTNPEITHSLGSIYLQKKQYQKALANFREVKYRFPEYNQSDLLYNDLAKTHFAIQAFDSAQYYYENLVRLKDIRQEETTANALTKAQENVDYIKKESEIKTLQLEKQILEADSLRNKILLFTLIFMLATFAATGFIYLKKQRAKRQLQEMELEIKNRKITEFKNKIEQRNKMINEIENKFAAYQDQQHLQDLKFEIIDTLDVGATGDSFNRYFEDQHSGLYHKLKEIAADLTNNDLRLCSLSKLRLSLKETANVLNLSVDAIKSGRYRIKKKLNLTAEDSLSDYLNAL